MKSFKGSMLLLLLAGAAFAAVASAQEADEAAASLFSSDKQGLLRPLAGIRRLLRHSQGGGGGGRFGPASYFNSPGWGYGGPMYGRYSTMVTPLRIPDETRMETSTSRRFAMISH